MRYPLVLVFSNNCFSKSDSNGRTMGNFFIGWPKEKLAQFYLQGVEPDFSYCDRYYRVTDVQAAKALCSGNKGGIVSPIRGSVNASLAPAETGKRKSRNAVTMLLREFVWHLGSWKNASYYQWLQEVNPEIVLLQAGDCGFLFDLARQTAEHFGAKLVIYNTEGYYFKKHDYFRCNGFAHAIYSLFAHNLKRAIRRAYQTADYAIFNCEALQEDFCKSFSVKSDVVYTATDIETEQRQRTPHADFITTYAGNFGVGRASSLVDVANTLQKVDKSLSLDIYGTIPNDEVKVLFETCPSIRYHGKVSYEEVKDILYSSDLVLHVESFESYFREDSKYAFSTKIADCLACGTCFLLYAPDEFAETTYLLRNQAAFVVTNREDLEQTLHAIVAEPDVRGRYCSMAQELVNRNHNKETSVSRFQKILIDLCD